MSNPQHDKGTKTPSVQKQALTAPPLVSAKTALAQLEGEETGFESTNSQDYSIPFLTLLQKGSPQCDDSKGGFIKEARPGMFFDAGSGELLDVVRVVPCHYSRKIVEWKSRESGGGFVAQHEPGEEETLPRNDKGVPYRENGNILVDTRYFFCMRLNENNDSTPVIIAMSSTQTKKAKLWMSRMQAIKATGEGGKRFTPPMYSHVWKLTSVSEQNDKGTWKGYKIELEGPITAGDLFRQAKDSRELFRSTEVKPQALLTEYTEDSSKSAM